MTPEIAAIIAALERGDRLIPASAPRIRFDSIPRVTASTREAAAEQLVAAAARFNLRPRGRELIETAVDELVSNALRVDASPELGVAISASHADVVVADRAGTLDADTVRRVLLRALRTGGAPAVDGPGAGLGLYLLLRRALVLGVSRSPAGTLVGVRLPLGRREGPFAALDYAELPDSYLQIMRIVRSG